MKKLSILLLIVFMTCCFVLTGCDDNSVSNNYDSNYNSNNSFTSSFISKEQAISYAKKSSALQNQIAKLYGMKFFYTPDWGTITARDTTASGYWTLTIKGTISGYTDDYKTDFEYDKKFTALVQVYSSEVIDVQYVSKG